MKFACESCRTQYVISDEKVGPRGVYVRCKKCRTRILVKRPEPARPEPADEPTMLVPAAFAFGNDAPPEAQTPSASAAQEEEAAPWTPSAAPVRPALDAQARASAPLAAPEASGALPAEGASPAEEDDEIGRAFDSVLLRDEGLAAAHPGAGEPLPGFEPGLSAAPRNELDQDATRVVDLARMAESMRPEPAPASRPEPKGPPAAAREAEEVEWYVAIDDQQVGPLSVQGVRDRWTSGELSADSLAWRPGLADWLPIASIGELVAELAPLPRPGALTPEGSGVAASSGGSPASVLPPAQAEPRAWKPSAASALESLVKEELAALERPASRSDGKQAERAPAEPARFQPAEVSVPAPSPAPVLPVSERPVLSAASPAPAPRARVGAWLAIAIGGGLSLGAAAVAVALFALRPPQIVVTAPPAAAESQAAQPEALEPAGQPAAPAAQTAAPAGGAAAEEAPAVAAKSPPAAEPPATPAPEAPEAAAAQPEPELKADAQESPKTADVRESRPQAPARKERARARAQRRAPAPEERESRTKVAQAGPRGRERSRVDEQFEQIFGSGSAGAGEDSTRSEARAKTVYVPPPVGGAGSLPEKLGQSDIMSVVLEQKAAIKACVDEQKAKDPGSSGTLVMRWIIRPNGTTANVQTRTAEFQKAPISACVARLIKTWKFPPYSGPQMPPIDFPFKF